MDAENPRSIVAAGLGYSRGGRRRLLGRGQQEPTPEMLAGFIGPSGLAAFYRKSALEAAGGLSAALSLAQADAELALTLSRMGFSAALEPSSVVTASREVETRESSLSLGLHEERLFWRNLPARGRAAAVAAHVGLVLADTIGGLARPATLAALAGRALACCQVGGYVRRHAMLAQLCTRSSTPATTREGTRFDSPHPAPALARATNVRVSSR
jgi:hypothetical protein